MIVELNQLSVPSMKQSDQQLKHPKHMIVTDDCGLHPTRGGDFLLLTQVVSISILLLNLTVTVLRTTKWHIFGDPQKPEIEIHYFVNQIKNDMT